jgi:hypothetical protein
MEVRVTPLEGIVTSGGMSPVEGRVFCSEEGSVTCGKKNHL